VDLRRFIVLAALVGCSNGENAGPCPTGQYRDADGNCIAYDIGGDGVDGGGTDGGSGCAVTGLASTPTDGATGVDPGITVRFTLSDADATAAVSLAPESGSPLTGSGWRWDGDSTAWFQAAGALAPAGTYVATLDWCGGSEVVSFTTAGAGTPQGDLSGAAYDLDLAAGTWVGDAGLSAIFGAHLLQDLMLGVAAADATSLDLQGSLGDGTGNQDTCDPTIDFDGADFSQNPFFLTGPTDLVLVRGGQDVALQELRVSGTFSADASAIEGGAVSALLDLRELGTVMADLLGSADPDEVCSALAGFSVSCQACPADDVPYCLRVLVEDVQGTRMSEPLAVVTQQDCYPTCAASYDNPACDTSGF